MERIPTPKDLRGSARVALALAYASGLAGVAAGALLYLDGQLGFAVVAWVLTFAAGALLVIAAFLARGMAALLGRIARIEQDVNQLLADRPREEWRSPPERDPWGHQPPY
jgi:ABC-type Na+ efflux pump permease subunit